MKLHPQMWKLIQIKIETYFNTIQKKHEAAILVYQALGFSSAAFKVWAIA